jgi:glyoxylase-like metal-dependent hydrolase (beta-lactamase superfamily II)
LRSFRALIKGFVPDLVPTSFEQQRISIESFRQVALDPVLQPFQFGYELPNSRGEIILIPLPGHATGHFGAMVLTQTGWQLVASDAAWSYKNYRLNQLPMKPANLIMDNVGDFYHTLQNLQQLDEKNIPIILSHEEILCD